MGKGVEAYLAAAENYDVGSFVWVLVATMFCWPITLGVGLLYSGFTNRKNAMATVWTSGCVLVMSSISWILFGMSFTYGPGNAFFGDTTYIGHKNVFDQPSDGLPILVFSLFQLTFQTATVAIFMGGAAERARLAPIPLLCFVWPIVIYNPIAHWTWTDNGWASKLGVMDFAGGTPVHIASGAASAAFSIYLSKPLFRSRKSASRSLRVLLTHRPHNLLQMTVALILIWGGWLSFDGCSTLALNFRSVVAATVTHVSACFGALCWCALEFRETRKWSMSGVVSGSISGLVAITPASGFVSVPSSMLVGAVGGTGCFFACKFKYTSIARKVGFVDPCDVTGCHWFGGVLGNFLTGIFGQATVAATDGATEIKGGWLDGNYEQLGFQVADILAVTAYSFVVTYCLVALIDCIPGLEVLATDEVIVQGIDAAYNGEYFSERQWEDDEKMWHPFLGMSHKDDASAYVPELTTPASAGSIADKDSVKEPVSRVRVQEAAVA